MAQNKAVCLYDPAQLMDAEGLTQLRHLLPQTRVVKVPGRPKPERAEPYGAFVWLCPQADARTLQRATAWFGMPVMVVAQQLPVAQVRRMQRLPDHVSVEPWVAGPTGLTLLAVRIQAMLAWAAPIMQGTQLEVERSRHAGELQGLQSQLQTETRLRQYVLRNVPLMLFVLDETGRCTEAEGGGWAAMGMHPNQVIGMTTESLAQGDPTAMVEFRRALRGTSFRCELQLRDRTWDCAFEPLLGVNGELMGTQAIALDITESKAIKLALDQQQRLMTEVLDQLPLNIMLKDSLGHYLFLNQMGGRTVGQDPHYVIGKTDYDIFPEHLASARRRDDHQTLERGAIPAHEEANLMPEGLRYLLTGQSALVVPGSDETFILRYGVDITDRKEAENELEAQREFIQQVLDTNPALIYVKDELGNYRLVNEAMAQLFQLSKEAILEGGAQHMGIPLAEQKASQIIDRKVLEFQKEVALEEAVTLPGGTQRWFYTIKRPLLGTHGERLLLGVSTDITHRKEAEAAMLEARLQAEQATAAKEKFLASMSHEIRTPLNGIQGLSSLIRQTNLNPEQREYIQLLDESADNLMSLLNAVLDLSKLNAGKMAVEHIPFHLEKVLQNVFRTYELRAKEKEIAFQVTLHPEVPAYLVGDPLRLTQILINLVSNAIKFTHQGQVSLRAYPSDLPAVNGQVFICFEVTDTGIGIAADRLTRIFESFEQGASDITRKYGGTGLGLSIVKELTRLLQGQIQVNSQPGTGSVFTVTLPSTISLTTSDASATSDYHDTLPAHLLSQLPSLRGKQVLVVDDHPVNQVITQRQLAKWEMATQVASNGLEALRMLQQNRYDLVLLDVLMPEMDGYETIQRIRTDLPAPLNGVPVIAMTALSVAEERERCLALGMDDYIGKPFKAAHLLEKMYDLLTAPAEAATEREVAARPQPPAFALDYLYQFFGGDEGFIKEIVQVSHMELSKDLQKVAQQPPADLDTLMRTAHRMKTNLAQLGNTRAAQLAARLERTAREGYVAPNTLMAVEQETRRVTDALAEWLKADSHAVAALL